MGKEPLVSFLSLGRLTLITFPHVVFDNLVIQAFPLLLVTFIDS